jgi:hypothetical protein
MSNETLVPWLRCQPAIPPALAPKLAPVLRRARNLGTGVSGTRGVGKSQLLKLLVWLSFTLHNTPGILLDPVGATIDSLLGQISYFHPDDQRRLWRRIRYVNLSPSEHVVPLPLYYRTGVGRESLYTISQRLPDCLVKLDPKLRDASVLGANALIELATHLGRILIALGYQPSEIAPLLDDLPAWTGKLQEAAARQPEVRDSADFLTDHFAALTPAGQRERSRSLLNKLVFLADPATKAQFCASTPGLDWTALMRERQLWLFDLRNEHDWEVRRFKLLFLWQAITDFARRWGAAHAGDRTQPLAVTIDEVSFMFSRNAGARSPLVDDLDGIINQYSRNVNLELTIAWQELYQLPPGLKETLLSLGTQFFGRMTDPDSMREVADRLTVHDARLGTITLVDGRPHEVGFAELRETNRRRLAALLKYTYLVSRTSEEGEPPLPVHTFSVAPLATRHYPDPTHLRAIREQLTRRDGLPIAGVLAEIAQRAPTPARAATPPVCDLTAEVAIETDDVALAPAAWGR